MRERDILCLNRQFSAAWHGVTRIHGEVHKDLFDLAGIDLYAPKVAVGNKGEFDVFADQPDKHLIHVCDHAIEVEDLRLHYLAAAERQQLPGQGSSTFGGSFHFLDAAAQGIAGQHLFGHDFDLAANYSEHVVEVMRNASRKLAHGLHLLRLTELVFELFAFADVLGNDVQV